MKNKGLKIAVLANLKDNAPASLRHDSDHLDDLDGRETIDALVDALASAGHSAQFFEASILSPHNLIEALGNFQPDLCFNIAEGHWGDGREAQIPSLLEVLRIPYTGSQVLTLALTLDKPMTKRILHYHNLPTPEFQVFGRDDDPIDDDLLTDTGELRFPMFVKPSREGTGIGIHAKSVVHTVAGLRASVRELLFKYQQPILAERFIEGREITVGVIGNLQPSAARRINERTAPYVLPDELTFFPPMEVNTTENGIYTNHVKVELAHTFDYACPADLSPALVSQLNLLTAAVFRVTGCLDVARVDFRLDANEKPYILEVNPLPGLNPVYSDLCIEAKAAGWSYEKLINHIVTLATERYSLLDDPIVMGHRYAR